LPSGLGDKKMIVKIDPDGKIALLELFTKKEASKIYYYTFEKLKEDGKVILWIYDKQGKQITPKLRKRGKVKKA
jgi:hypothetical protein